MPKKLSPELLRDGIGFWNWLKEDATRRKRYLHKLKKVYQSYQTTTSSFSSPNAVITCLIQLKKIRIENHKNALIIIYCEKEERNQYNTKKQPANSRDDDTSVEELTHSLRTLALVTSKKTATDEIEVDTKLFELGVDEHGCLPITIKNNSNQILSLREISVLNKNSEFYFRGDCKTIALDKFVLPPQHTCKFDLLFSSAFVGLRKESILILFKSQHLLVEVTASVGNQDLLQKLKPTEPFKKPPSVILPAEKDIVRGIPLPSKGLFKVQLDKYSIPYSLNNIEKDEDKLEKRLGVQLNLRTYSDKFDDLLWIEEKQLKLDILRYRMSDATVVERENMFWLEVPGLAERRPSILVGDKVYLYIESSKKKYEGYVHKVALSEVGLKFHHSFKSQHIRGQYYNVEFSFNRLPQRRMHNALTILNEDETSARFLFPSKTLVLSSVTGINPIDRKLNEEQQQAVKMILFTSHSPSPYIIFGPPGTGKTSTMVEAILQTYRRSPQLARILVCAPANTAADLFIERLMPYVSKNEMVRINSFTRMKQTPPKIKDYVEENFEAIKKSVMTKKIVVTTCMTAGMLYALEVPSDYFTHIFIDEAGHAQEPETMVAIAGLASMETKIILAGDPQQLGPIIRSPWAKKHGLEISYIERLIKDPKLPFSRSQDVNNNSAGFDPLYVTKLVNNYRSHEKILKLPSQMFYDNELIPKAQNPYFKWDKLKNQSFPMLFHGVRSQDEREGNSPSWFNPHEVDCLVSYVKQLTQDAKVQLQDIGIITPYRKQVEKIQKGLEAKGLSAVGQKTVMVGSVEEFQGQERRVIIISTVRSDPKHLDHDTTFKLGFLTNPKRFNVAITRAQSLVIIVGNPEILSKDKYWGELLKYCHSNNAYVGQPFELNWFDKRKEELLEIKMKYESAISKIAEEEDPVTIRHDS